MNTQKVARYHRNAWHGITEISTLASGGNKDFTIKELKDLNHMFQECNTGMIDEYGKIDQTFSPTALNEISKFVLEKSGLTNKHLGN